MLMFLLIQRDEEEERRKRRREKNKVAAARCRNKKKERTEYLQKVSICSSVVYTSGILYAPVPYMLQTAMCSKCTCTLYALVPYTLQYPTCSDPLYAWYATVAPHLLQYPIHSSALYAPGTYLLQYSVRSDTLLQDPIPFRTLCAPVPFMLQYSVYSNSLSLTLSVLISFHLLLSRNRSAWKWWTQTWKHRLKSWNMNGSSLSSCSTVIGPPASWGQTASRPLKRRATLSWSSWKSNENHPHTQFHITVYRWAHCQLAQALDSKHLDILGKREWLLSDPGHWNLKIHSRPHYIGLHVSSYKTFVGLFILFYVLS